MKKFFSVFSFLAMTAIAAVSFVSCSDDNKEPEPKPQPTENYARCRVLIEEAIFEYIDFTFTIEHDGTIDTYKMDETTKISDTKLDDFAPFFDRKVSGRLFDKVFKYETLPVKYSAKYEFTEEGKKKIAAAADGDVIMFYGAADLYKSDKDGKMISHDYHSLSGIKDCPVKDLEEGLADYAKMYPQLFSRSF